MKNRTCLIIITALFFCVIGVNAAAAAAVFPKTLHFETDHWSTPENGIDLKVEATLKQHGVKLRKSCSDDVFIRRIYIDMIGTLPTPSEIKAFSQNTKPDKRAQLINSLFEREEFADYWSLKWCDILRVKSEYPINLWPDAVQSYHHWIRSAVHQNMPYNKFVYDILTSSGSNFRVPPVNFYRAVQGKDPNTIAKAVALSFMGTRLEKWSKASQKNMSVFFSRLSYKKTDEWKEEIVCNNSAPDACIKGIFPDGNAVTIPAGADPRFVFAKWLVAPNNKWFARNIVNRIWAWTMGHGIINEPDDIRPDNPPASPELLAYLQKELVKSHYNLRHIYKLIFNSRTYQQSSIPNNDTASEKTKFAHYTVRRLDAEVLIDALCTIGGEGDGYTSATPEPYSFIPKEKRTITLADGSVTSSFLSTFGRPSRDTGLESERNNNPSDEQSLYLLNSTDLKKKINQSPVLKQIVAKNRRDLPSVIRETYLFILSRRPAQNEADAALQYFHTSKLNVQQATDDLAWALINCKEFLYRH